MLIPPAVDRIGLRATPLVFALVFALGAWADPIDLFGLPAGWIIRAVFTVAVVAMAAAAARPDTDTRFVAFIAGMTAALSRGLTVIVIGQDHLLRKAELIGGGVWVSVAWLVFAVWVLTVPAAARRAER